MKEVLTTDISEYPLFWRGKVRDVYDLDDNLLIVTTDRLSAFDVVLPNGIPGRGALLTDITVFWFDFLKEIVDSHLVTADIDQYPEPLKKYRDTIGGRSMIVRKAKRVDVECIVRGYISGSMWKEYQAISGGGEKTLHNMTFPGNLQESDKFPAPIFTPSTKADEGHDENISFEMMVDAVGQDLAEKCRDKSLEIYSRASEFALSRGIIIADTKFEFGFDGDRFILIDEALTPDSSRFWPTDQYAPGKSQPSFDKQIIRNYLNGLDWDKTAPGPILPEEIIKKTQQKYEEVVTRLTKQ